MSQALRVYRESRVERTARVVRESAGNRGLYRVEDEHEMRRRFPEMNMSKSRAEWLYSYDPLTVPLTNR